MSQDTEKSEVERDIDDNLRKVYREMVEQEVPDRFRDLLDQLRQSEETKDPEANK
jgi:hypothetical protein